MKTQREIKFRIWDDAPVKDGYPGVMINMDYALNSNYLKDAINGKYPIMLFVNKIDKSKNEICIGDIIKIDGYGYVDPLIGEVKQLEGGQIYIDHQKVYLKYKHQIHCEICDVDSPPFLIDFFDPYELEIIGNIYENPELIKI